MRVGVSIPAEVVEALRAEVERQRRPVSWIITDILAEWLGVKVPSAPLRQLHPKESEARSEE